MRFAIKNNQRIFPNPLEKEATCPICGSKVIAKCGKINVWHWAHKNSEDCDSFGEPETEWHLNWKSNFPTENQEVIIGNHRADIKINGIVIEIQNSRISQEQIIEREDFYNKMKWVLNGETIAKNLKLFEYKEFYKFKWKWFPKSWYSSKKPLYIDLSYLKKELVEKIKKGSKGEINYCSDGCYLYYSVSEKQLERLRNELDQFLEKDLFLIKKLSRDGRGWGKLLSKQDFIQECKNGYY